MRLGRCFHREGGRWENILTQGVSGPFLQQFASVSEADGCGAESTEVLRRAATGHAGPLGSRSPPFLLSASWCIHCSKPTAKPGGSRCKAVMSGMHLMDSQVGEPLHPDHWLRIRVDVERPCWCVQLLIYSWPIAAMTWALPIALCCHRAPSSGQSFLGYWRLGEWIVQFT